MSKDYEPQYLYKENQYYKIYLQEKEELQSRYPKEIWDETLNKPSRSKNKPKPLYYDSYLRTLHLEYLKELSDIIFAQNSNYQKFTWDIIGEVEQLEMERRARGRIYGGNGEYS